MPTILSRFDMIFIIKDEHDVVKDTVSLHPHTIIISLSLPPSFLSCSQRLAKHVMKVHLSALQEEEEVEGELSLALLKKYIAFCKS